MVTDGPKAGKLFIETIKAPSVWLAFGMMVLVRASSWPMTYLVLWSFRFDPSGWLAKLGVAICVLAAISCYVIFVMKIVDMSKKVQQYKRQGNEEEWRIFVSYPKNRPSPSWILAAFPLINLIVPLAAGLTIWGSINFVDPSSQKGSMNPAENPQIRLEQTLAQFRKKGIFRLP